MRCPHCAGEIPQASRFCGICGRSLTTPPRSRTTTSPLPPAEDPGSLFEMPPTRKGRAARLFIVLALDAILAIAGIAMIVAYVRARAAATESAPRGDADAGVTAEVKVLPPTPVPRIGDGVTSPATPTATSGAERSARSAPARAGRDAGKTAPARGARAGVTPPAPAVDEPVGPLPEPAESDGAGSAAESDEAESGGVRGGSPETIDSGGVRGGSPETIDDESMSRLAARIELVVSSHQGQIQRCYAQAAKVTTPEDPLEGKIDVRFSLMPDGSASNVRAVRNTSESPQLASCLVGLVRSWTFPDGVAEPIDFLWPFQFSAPRNK